VRAALGWQKAFLPQERVGDLVGSILNLHPERPTPEVMFTPVGANRPWVHSHMVVEGRIPDHQGAVEERYRGVVELILRQRRPIVGPRPAELPHQVWQRKRGEVFDDLASERTALPGAPDGIAHERDIASKVHKHTRFVFGHRGGAHGIDPPCVANRGINSSRLSFDSAADGRQGREVFL